MSDTTDKMDSLEIKVKKLITLYNELLKENKRLKTEIEKQAKSGEQNNEGEIIKRRGRPINTTDEASKIIFEDNKEMRKLINELIEEIDKNITKLED